MQLFYGLSNKYFFETDIDLDKFGNHNFRAFLNATIQINNGYDNGNKIGQDLVGMVTDSQILICGANNNGSEVMNGYSQELIIYNEDKDDDFLDKLTT